MSKQWKDELRRRMSDYEEGAPKGLWEDISRAMQESGHPIKPARSPMQTLLHWGWQTAAAVLVAVLCWEGYRHIEADPAGAEHYVASTQPADIPSDTFVPEELKEEDHSTHQVKPIVRRVRPADLPPHPTLPPSEENPGEESRTTENTDNRAPEEQRAVPESSRHTPREKQQKDRNYYWLASGGPSKKSPKRWSVGLNTSNTGGTSNSEPGDHIMGVMLNAPLKSGESGSGSQLMSTSPSVPFFNLNRSTYTRTRHKQPIKVGASLRYAVNRKWSVETGLTYSKLSSTKTSGDESYYVESDQTLHYVGIPLKAIYTLWDHKQVTLYASAGGEVEKCVSGKVVSRQMRDKDVESDREEDLTVKRLQCSASATVGAQYKLSRSLGVYVEPGVSYHFNNGEHVETIYKDRPLNFQLKVGVRFQMGQ